MQHCSPLLSGETGGSGGRLVRLLTLDTPSRSASARWSVRICTGALWNSCAESAGSAAYATCIERQTNVLQDVSRRGRARVLIQEDHVYC
jgi:hypothetical protein